MFGGHALSSSTVSTFPVVPLGNSVPWSSTGTTMILSIAPRVSTKLLKSTEYRSWSQHPVSLPAMLFATSASIAPTFSEAEFAKYTL
jgi:hypothetical protein